MHKNEIDGNASDIHSDTYIDFGESSDKPMSVFTNSNKLMSQSLVVPAQLFAGDNEATAAHAKKYMQQLFCVHNACTRCVPCVQIVNKQYHNMLWLESEKNYTREQLEPIFETIIFSRSFKNPFFFVIQNADYLTSACANSLLKSLEEPPTGYYFILLSSRADQLLPTIRSRCTLSHIQGFANAYVHMPMFEIFTNMEMSDPTVFLKLLEKTKITEQESVQLLDQLLDYWINVYKTTIENNPENKNEERKNKAQQFINIFKTALEKSPMPGSSKLLWKNLFLQKMTV